VGGGEKLKLAGTKGGKLEGVDKQRCMMTHIMRSEEKLVLCFFPFGMIIP
jgi:hypothetical protein